MRRRAPLESSTEGALLDIMRCFEVDGAHPKFGDITSATERKDGARDKRIILGSVARSIGLVVALVGVMVVAT